MGWPVRKKLIVYQILLFDWIRLSEISMITKAIFPLKGYGTASEHFRDHGIPLLNRSRSSII